MKKLSKILTFIALAVGFIALVFTGMIWSIGQEAIQSEASVQLYSVDPLFIISYVLLGLAVLSILFFVISSWVKNPKSFISALKYIGFFAVVLVAAYFLTDNSPMMINQKPISPTDIFIAGFGLNISYILIAFAVLVVAFGGLLKKIKK